MRKAAVIMLLSAAIALGTCCAWVGAAGQPPYALMRVPLSGASYVPPEDPPPAPAPAAPANPPAEDRLKRVEDKLDRVADLLEKFLKLAAEETPPAEDADAGFPRAEAGAARPADDGLKSLKEGLSKCVACHNDKSALEKGDKVILFRGLNFRNDMGKRELLAINKVVADGTMPKRPKKDSPRLTPGEREAILAEVSARLKNLDGK